MTVATDTALLDRRVIEAGHRPLELAAEAQQHALERMGRFCDEGLRFLALRLEANRAAVQAFGGCRTVPETVSAWSAYLDSAAGDYSEEFERMAGLCTDQARAMLDEVQHEVAESLAPLAPRPAEADT